MHLSWKYIFDQIKKYKKQLIIGNIIAVIATLISIPVPLFIPLLVDEVLLGKEGVFIKTYRAVFGEGSIPLYVLTALVIVLIMRTLFFLLSALQTKIFTEISKNITFKIREKILNHIKDISMSEFEVEGSGKLASKMITDINTIDEFIGKTVSRFVISVLIILGVAVVLLLINWKLGLLIILINPVVVYFTTAVGRKIGKLKKKENKAVEIFQEALIETLELFRQIRTANREFYFISKLLEEAKKVRDTSVQFGWKSDAAARLSMLIFLSGYEVFRSVSILFVAYSDLTIGMMLAIFGYLWVMMTPIQEILSIQYSFHSANVALQRLNEILSLKTEPKYPHLKNPFKNKTTVSIKLEDVWFSYDKENFVLKAVNMNIPEKSKIAIIGASGSGKTTVANIIVGFYPVDKGQLYYDNVPVNEIGLDVVRENVYVVLQNPQMFNNTVRFNLTLGKDIPEEEIWEALKIAVADEFVKRMPKGLDTLVGKNGIRLSGGERQRLAIARMILSKPKAVILDESTSALDYKTEEKLMKNLEDYLKDKTTILIAHRLSTVKNADYIYVLDKGKIIEEGNHYELLEKEGIYSQYIKTLKG